MAGGNWHEADSSPFRGMNEKSRRMPAFFGAGSSDYFLASSAAGAAASAAGAAASAAGAAGASAAGAAAGASAAGAAASAAGAAGASAAGAAAGAAGASAAGAAASAAGAAGASSFLPQAVRVRATSAATRSEFFIWVFLSSKNNNNERQLLRLTDSVECAESVRNIISGEKMPGRWRCGRFDAQ